MAGLILVILPLLAHQCFSQSSTPQPSSPQPGGASGDAEPNIVGNFPKGSCGHVAVDPLPNRGFVDSHVHQTVVKKNTTGRIVGGETARPKSIPWIVSIRHRDLDFKHFCGGSLIRVNPNVEATDIVVTASHCVADFELGKVYLVAGAFDRSGEGDYEQSSDYKVAQKHEKYNRRTYENDIAIVKLAKAINFTDAVQPICLPQQGERLDIGTVGLVAGWGKLGETAKIADELQQLDVPVFNHSVCYQYYSDRYTIYDDLQLCAGFSEAGKDSCQGDSGGPLAFKKKQGYTLEGAVSFGIGCARQERPGVYARVANYVDWINGKVKELSDVAKQ